MTAQMPDPGSPGSTSSTASFVKDIHSAISKFSLQKRLVVMWLVMILLPLAVVRLSLFYAFPERITDPELSSEFQAVAQNVNFTSPSKCSSANATEKCSRPNAIEASENNHTATVQNLIAKGTEKCDLYEGEWIHDSTGPAYSNSTCEHIQGHQNCLKNGRPDTEYMYWRWKPTECDLPRFNATLFMELMKGKVMTFVGDSIARNHMQSLLCSLSQIERPKKTYTDEGDRFVRWWFPTYSFTLVTFWSPYLVLQTDGELHNNSNSISKLELDVIDPAWAGNLTEIDVLVISSGQWLFKPNLYFSNRSIVGCHYCPGMNITSVGFYYAYREILTNVLKALSKNTEYHGLTLVRTFSPDHFEDGRWDTGGSCKRTFPFTNVTLPVNSLTWEMHRIQVEAVEKVTGSNSGIRVGVEKLTGDDTGIQVGKVTGNTGIQVVDVTNLSYLRPDAHPGPYRNFEPFAKEFTGKVQNDCLHWCIPGAVDTWNELILETLRRQLQ